MSSPLDLLPEDLQPVLAAREARGPRQPYQRRNLLLHRRRLPVLPPEPTPRAPDAPRTWGECKRRGLGLPGSPCCYVACKWNIYLDVTPTGKIVLAFPELRPEELPCACALRVAEAGGHPFDAVAHALAFTRERARELCRAALVKLGLPPGLGEQVRHPPQSPLPRRPSRASKKAPCGR